MPREEIDPVGTGESSKKIRLVRRCSHAHSGYPGPIVFLINFLQFGTHSNDEGRHILTAQPHMFFRRSLNSMVPRCCYFNPLHTKFGAIIVPHSIRTFSSRVLFTPR